MVYARPEDEYFHKHAEWSFTFPVANRTTEKDELRQLRIVMCLKPAKLKAARYIIHLPWETCRHACINGIACACCPFTALNIVRTNVRSSLIHIGWLLVKVHLLNLHLGCTFPWLSVCCHAMPFMGIMRVWLGPSICLALSAARAVCLILLSVPVKTVVAVEMIGFGHEGCAHIQSVLMQAGQGRRLVQCYPA